MLTLNSFIKSNMMRRGRSTMGAVDISDCSLEDIAQGRHIRRQPHICITENKRNVTVRTLSETLS